GGRAWAADAPSLDQLDSDDARAVRVWTDGAVPADRIVDELADDAVGAVVGVAIRVAPGRVALRGRVAVGVDVAKAECRERLEVVTVRVAALVAQRAD